ncbi:MAG: histone H1 [Candidatus Kapaibacterium sp.]|jgi:hypothetical protein|nr:hypothetical protein [Chlorobiota bacterium]
MDRFNQLKSLVDSFEKDFEKFYLKDNKAAGVRVRKHMQDLRALAQDIRAEVQSKKKDDTEVSAG